MPVMLILCFLVAALLFLNMHVYISGKQNIVHEERSLKLEWLLRNGEAKWLQTTNVVKETSTTFTFPEGSVRVLVTPVRNDTFAVELTAEDFSQHERRHRFYVNNLERENEIERRREEYKEKGIKEEG